MVISADADECIQSSHLITNQLIVTVYNKVRYLGPLQHGLGPRPGVWGRRHSVQRDEGLLVVQPTHRHLDTRTQDDAVSNTRYPH